MASRTAHVPALSPVAAVLVGAALLVSGCSSGSSGSKSKPAGPIMTQAATAMRAVTSLSFAITTTGNPIKVKSATGNLLKNGNATGNVQVSELGALLQLDLTIVGDTVYVKGLTGGYQKMSRASVTSIYDPTAVLDPNRGVVPLLSTATNATTDGTQSVDGHTCDHVHATLAGAIVKNLVPGVSQNLPAWLWIDHSSHRLIKTVVTVPAKGSNKGGTVTITFSNFNTPFTITPPTSG
jgi:lipoprotein LprG